MDWLNRLGVKYLLFIILCQPMQGLKFWCNNITCALENLDLNEEYTFAFSYPINTTNQLTASYVKGHIFDLTILPNLSNLRDFVLDRSLLDGLIVRLTAEKSTVTVTNTPLKMIIFHETYNLDDVRIDNTLLMSVPKTVFAQKLLETLFITHSLLTVIDFELFEQLPNLRYVDFSFNKIHDVHIPAASTCCRRLITLDLQQNRLESFNFGLVSHMNCLEVITLRRNRLVNIENIEPKGKPPNLAQYCTTVVYGFDVKQQRNLTSHNRYASLITIDLDGNRMRILNISMFASMPNLMDLMIGRNLLSSITVTEGQRPTRLEGLDLSFNRLANADLGPIFYVKNVNVGGNQ